MSTDRCPSCRSAVEVGVGVCPLCGTAISASPPAAAGWGAPPAPPAVPGWGAPQEPGAWGTPGRPDDGAAFDGSAVGERGASSTSRHRRRRSGPLLAVVVVLVAGAALVAWLVTRSDSSLGETWQEATTSTAAYTVELPGAFQRLREDTDVAGVSLPVEVLAVGEGGLERLEPGALFIEVDTSAQPLVAAAAAQPELARTLLQAQARATFDTAGVTFDSAADAESPLGPAVRLTGTVPAQDLVVRAFVALHGGKVVAAVTIRPADRADVADADLERIVGSITPA